MQTYSFDQKHIINIPTEKALTTENLQVFYGDNHAMHDATLEFPRYRITALIGASGSGKSTYLRCLNRMNE